MFRSLRGTELGAGVTGIVAVLLSLYAAEGRQRARPTQYEFEATAYSLTGEAKDGVKLQAGIVAADPTILPLGTKIEITGAGPYSGTYLVADTGAKVKGKQVDIYVPNPERAKRFGRRIVRVQILKWGAGKP